MKPKLHLVTNCLNDFTGEDYDAAVQQVAEIGYAGVEIGHRMPEGVTDEQAARAIERAGLEVAAMSRGAQLAFGGSARSVVDAMNLFGCKHLTFGSTTFLSRGPFRRKSQIETTCGVINETLYAAREWGDFRVGVHNHEAEFALFEDRPVLDIMLEHLDPEVFLLLDTYWAQTAGADVAAFLDRAGDRVRGVHVKDGPCRRGEPNTAVGAGVMDWSEVLPAAERAEWFSVEIEGLDSETALKAAVASYAYLIGEGFAEGNR